MQPNVQFTYDNIPALPDGGQPLPAQNFARPQMQSTDGIPQFEVVAIRLPDGSYTNVEYVTILTPGDPKAMPRHKVNDALRQRYAPYYDMFRRGLEMSPIGTPLEMWPLLTPAQIRELKAVNIFTVEQLSEIADGNLHRIPMGATMKVNAVKWLKVKKDSDAIEQQVRENQVLKDGQSMMEKRMEELAARLDAAERRANTAEAALVSSPLDEPELPAVEDGAPAKRGPGRPAKN